MSDVGENKVSVSVIIPAYNLEPLIARAIDSVLAQTRPADEIIIVNDGSTDKTEDVVRQYGDRVRCLCQENAGAARARNRGIEASCGEWVTFLDGDDVFEPEKLERQLELLRRNPHLVWCYGNFRVRPYGTDHEYLSHDPRKACALLNGRDHFENYLAAYAAGFATSMITVMIRRSVLREVGGFEPDLPWGQDSDLALRIAYRYPEIGYVGQALAVNYFRRPESITETHKYNTAARCRFLETHLRLSEQFGKRQEFERCAGILLGRWIRQMFDGGDLKETARMCRRFRALIPARLRWEAEVRRIAPWTARGIEGYFALKRRWRQRPNNGSDR